MIKSVTKWREKSNKTIPQSCNFINGRRSYEDDFSCWPSLLKFKGNLQ